MKFQKFHSDWVIGVAVTLVFMFIVFSGHLDFTHSIEMKSYDLLAWISASDEKSQDIELVTITDDDLNEIGGWPWPRSIIAKGIDNLHEAGAKVIALDILFPKPEENAGLTAIRNLKKEFDELKLAQRENNGLVFFKKMTDEEKNLDNDAKLEHAIKNAGNVVLPFHLDNVSQVNDEMAPTFVSRDSFKKIDHDKTSDSDIEWYVKIIPPLRRFTDVAAGTGYNQVFSDKSDGYLRKQLYVLGYLDDIYVPSYAVTIVKVFKGLSDEKVMLSLSEKSGKFIDFKVSPTSDIKVPLMEYEKGTLINWKDGSENAFRRTPFSKILKKETGMEIFKNKIVIIGNVLPEMGLEYTTPVSGRMPGIEVLANTVDNILNQKFYHKPLWTKIVEFGALLFFGLFLSFVLPRLKTGIGTGATFFLFLAYGTTGSFLFFSRNIWLEITPPLILLIAGYILIISKRFLVTAKTMEKVGGERVHNSKNPVNPAKFVENKVTHSGNIEDTPVNTNKPILGRYEVVGKLGRGAMGAVYKGEDPKIHRTVAIKTVRLSDFDENNVDEIKGRFFREAESAGLLTHPNIVTIYDAGEEHDLAYIAMELLKGKNLEELTKNGSLLPIKETLSVVAQVAEALDYAHSKGIVHRDIKPANIMRLDETGEIKVTDFGIAKISTSSKTKTGIVMGTPSYMSPEQVTGKKVDGRSDIFSLGVVLYELLCGKTPFNGHDMSSLMYAIAKEKHPSVKTINPKIPVIIEKVVDKALEKDVGQRYQKAGQMAWHLRIILKKINEAANRKSQIIRAMNDKNKPA